MRNNIIHREVLKSADGTAWASLAMTTATGTYYSDSLRVKNSKGHSALLVLTSAGTSALAITFEVSMNGVDFYTPYDTDGNDLGVVVTGLAANRWIVFNPQVAEYIRFKFVLTGANSTVSATYIQQE